MTKPWIERELRDLARAEPPALSEAQRALQIREVIQRAHAGQARTLPSRWRELIESPRVWALAACVLLLVGAFALRPGMPWQRAASPVAALTVVSGSVEGAEGRWTAGGRPPLGKAIRAVKEPAELRFRDGSALLLSPGAVALCSLGPGQHVGLELGESRYEVKPRSAQEPFVVETAEARVTVVGTRFVVERKVGETTVHVEEGAVQVTSKLDSSTKTLHAGDELLIAEAPAVVLEREPSVAQKPRPSLAATPSAIRQVLAKEGATKARHLIAEARRQGTTSAAELEVLEAEAYLAEGRYAAARARYLSVHQKFPKTPQGELSLFAAAELSRGQEALDLTRRYLANYPGGTFSTQARRKLQDLENGARGSR